MKAAASWQCLENLNDSAACVCEFVNSKTSSTQIDHFLKEVLPSPTLWCNLAQPSKQRPVLCMLRFVKILFETAHGQHQ